MSEKLASTQRRRDREKAAEALGRELKYLEVLHHCPISRTLIVCKDESYHNLIERRTRALQACGHPDWWKCRYCKEYDSPDNMKLHKVRGRSDSWMFHRECKNKYNQRLSLQHKHLKAVNQFLAAFKGGEING